MTLIYLNSYFGSNVQYMFHIVIVYLKHETRKWKDLKCPMTLIYLNSYFGSNVQYMFHIVIVYLKHETRKWNQASNICSGNTCSNFSRVRHNNEQEHRDIYSVSMVNILSIGFMKKTNQTDWESCGIGEHFPIYLSTW